MEARRGLTYVVPPTFTQISPKTSVNNSPRQSWEFALRKVVVFMEVGSGCLDQAVIRGNLRRRSGGKRAEARCGLEPVTFTCWAPIRSASTLIQRQPINPEEKAPRIMLITQISYNILNAVCRHRRETSIQQTGMYGHSRQPALL